MSAQMIPEYVPALTAREREVLSYLPGRLKNQDIADDLFVSVNTVKSHVRSLYAKLGVCSRDEAIACAQELGLLTVELRIVKS